MVLIRPRLAHFVCAFFFLCGCGAGAALLVVNALSGGSMAVPTIAIAAFAGLDVKLPGPLVLFTGNQTSSQYHEPTGRLFATDALHGTVNVLDVASRRIVAVVQVGDDPGFIRFSPSGDRAIVTNRGDGTITVIDPGDGSDGSPPRAVASVDLYALHYAQPTPPPGGWDSDPRWRTDENDATGDTWFTEDDVVPYAVEFDANGTHAFITCRLAKSLVVLGMPQNVDGSYDATNLLSFKQFPRLWDDPRLDSEVNQPTALAVGRDHIYVLHTGRDEAFFFKEQDCPVNFVQGEHVSVAPLSLLGVGTPYYVDTRLVEAVRVGRGPTGIAISRDPSTPETVYVANRGSRLDPDREISVITRDAGTLSVDVIRDNVPNGPLFMLLDEGAGRLYVAHEGDTNDAAPMFQGYGEREYGALCLIDTASKAVVAGGRDGVIGTGALSGLALTGSGTGTGATPRLLVADSYAEPIYGKPRLGYVRAFDPGTLSGVGSVEVAEETRALWIEDADILVTHPSSFSILNALAPSLDQAIVANVPARGAGPLDLVFTGGMGANPPVLFASFAGRDSSQKGVACINLDTGSQTWFPTADQPSDLHYHDVANDPRVYASLSGIFGRPGEALAVFEPVQRARLSDLVPPMAAPTNTITYVGPTSATTNLEGDVFSAWLGRFTPNHQDLDGTGFTQSTGGLVLFPSDPNDPVIERNDLVYCLGKVARGTGPYDFFAASAFGDVELGGLRAELPCTGSTNQVTAPGKGALVTYSSLTGRLNDILFQPTTSFARGVGTLNVVGTSSPTQQYAVTSHYLDHTASIVDTGTLRETRVSVDFRPFALAADESSSAGYVYVACLDDLVQWGNPYFITTRLPTPSAPARIPSLVRIDPSNGNTATLPRPGNGPLALKIVQGAAGDRLYVANYFDGTVTIIDTATLTEVAGSPVAVGKGPLSLTCSRDDSRVYVGNAIDGTISVIDAATEAVIQTIALQPQ